MFSSLKYSEKELNDLMLFKFNPLEVYPSDFFEMQTEKTLMGHANYVSGVYQYITIELCEFLKQLICDKKTIEICAGHGAIGKYLGIPSIDRKLMIKEAKEYYSQFKQLKTIDYPNHIIEMTANQALKFYNPEIVIGSWVTQKYISKKDIDASIYGVEEEKIIDKCEMYIHIGNKNVHGTKRINKTPHYLIKADFLFSRAINSDLNEIRIYTKKEIDFSKIDSKIDIIKKPFE